MVKWLEIRRKCQRCTEASGCKVYEHTTKTNQGM